MKHSSNLKALIALLLFVFIFTGCSIPKEKSVVKKESEWRLQQLSQLNNSGTDFIHDKKYNEYINSLKKIGILSADNKYIWCGKSGIHSLEEGYGGASSPLESADIKTFHQIGGDKNYGYFKDKNTIYFAGRYEDTSCNKIAHPDINSFQYLFGPFAKDNSQVYLWGKALIGVSPAIKLLTDKDQHYLTDGIKLYYWSEDAPWNLTRFNNIDPLNFDLNSDFSGVSKSYQSAGSGIWSNK